MKLLIFSAMVLLLPETFIQAKVYSYSLSACKDLKDCEQIKAGRALIDDNFLFENPELHDRRGIPDLAVSLARITGESTEAICGFVNLLADSLDNRTYNSFKATMSVDNEVIEFSYHFDTIQWAFKAYHSSVVL